VVIYAEYLFIANPRSAPDSSSETSYSPLSTTLGSTLADLESCAEDHTSVCPANADVPLPSRLLDVGMSEQDPIRLVITGTEGLKTGKYVALSYCWGNFPAFTTTPATLDQRCRRMDWTEIPRTLRHAIQVTRHLGLQYLWIDALCILQGTDSDARRDWEMEAGHMADIYGNAFLTIVALGARDCDGGLFEPRMSSTLPVDGCARDSVTLYFNEGLKDYKDEPLNSRAWALQEWHLSARLLVFAASGIFFHCSRKGGKFPGLKSGAHRIYWYRLPQKIEKAHPGYLDWRLLVENYCSRSLTNSTDKLPAFSALVRRYHSISNGQNGRYLAGLWESALLGDLLWRHEDAFSGFYANPRVSKCDSYKAPSWSWASCDYIVSYISYHLNAHPESYVARVIECTTELATADPFGGVSSARLVIKGPSKLPTVDDILHGRVGSVYYDATENAGKSRVTSACAVACLLIQITKYAGYRHGLLLVKEAKDCLEYKRVAFICASGEDVNWWENLTEREFTIV